MQLPTFAPMRPIAGRAAADSLRLGSSMDAEDTASLQPASCCAQICVDTPFGHFCHCVLDLPVCP